MCQQRRCLPPGQGVCGGQQAFASTAGAPMAIRLVHLECYTLRRSLVYSKQLKHGGSHPSTACRGDATCRLANMYVAKSSSALLQRLQLVWTTYVRELFLYINLHVVPQAQKPLAWPDRILFRKPSPACIVSAPLPVPTSTCGGGLDALGDRQRGPGQRCVRHQPLQRDDSSLRRSVAIRGGHAQAPSKRSRVAASRAMRLSFSIMMAFACTSRISSHQSILMCLSSKHDRTGWHCCLTQIFADFSGPFAGRLW